MRQDVPTLVFAPTVTIQEQWARRFEEAFLPHGYSAAEWVSTSLQNLRPLTIVTYQAFFAAAGSPAELTAHLQAFGISTFCLDEAHHLKTEWWKALTVVKNNLSANLTTIALTATPPYDSTALEWNRYIELCGNIDSEIFAPELVADGTLCPHQDFVYFNFPATAETEQISAFQTQSQSIFDSLMDDQKFIATIAGHTGLQDPQAHADAFLTHPDYFFALLSFLRSQDIALSGALKAIVSSKVNASSGASSGAPSTLDATIPPFTIAGLEILLQGFLFEDSGSYPQSDEERRIVHRGLARTGHLDNKTVVLRTNSELSRSLVTSQGKLDSIVSIARAENENLGSQLRLLVLADYIRKDALIHLNGTREDFTQLGVVPIFAMLKNSIHGMKPAVLSGSLVIVPKSAISRLDQLALEQGITWKYTPVEDSRFMCIECSSSVQHSLVSAVTRIFEEGLITTIVGTKSLLGEGWDSPCVNSLILASFVGSTVTSNQMRGRAIRSFPGDPGKTANIWHLVCMDPRPRHLLADWAGTFERTRDPLSQDYETLRRRFTHFVGVSYSGESVESGIERLGSIRPPYTPAGIENINSSMLVLAAQRSQLRATWKNALSKVSTTTRDIVLSETTATKRSSFPLQTTNDDYAHSKIASATTLVTAVVSSLAIVLTIMVFTSGSAGFAIFTTVFEFLQAMWLPLLGVVCVPVATVALVTAYQARHPERLIQAIGNCVLETLQETGNLPRSISQVQVYETATGTYGEESSEATSTEVSDTDQILFETCLTSGSLHDKNLYADAMAEILAPVAQPRYLIEQHVGHINYLQVPEILGRRESDARLLAKKLSRVIGTSTAIYTRTPAGRSTLLKAQALAFAHRDAAFIRRQSKAVATGQASA